MSEKKCKICGVLKSIGDDGAFPVKERTANGVRWDSICLECKRKQQAERRSAKKTEAHKTTVQPLKVVLEEPAVPPQRPLLVTNGGSNTDSGAEVGKFFKHPEYKNWEVKKTINFFQTLKRLRDKARASGQIDW